MIGIFFFIKSKTLNYNDYLYNGIAEETAERYGRFLTSSLGHAELFDGKFLNTTIEYFDFPRGRVVFDIENNRHIIYIDNCIKAKITEIAEIFKLNSYNVEKDEHYVCKKCIGDDLYE